MAEAFWLADTRSDGALGAFLAWRCDVVTSLVAEIRAAVRKDAAVAVIPSVARPTGGAWYEGSDLAALAEAAGIIEACFYEPQCRARARRCLGREAPHRRRRQDPRHPAAGASRPQQRAARSSRAVAGAARRPASTTSPSTITAICATRSLAWIARRAAGDLETEHGFQGQGRRDHRRGRRHRPGALPLLRRRGRDDRAPSTGARPSTAFADELREDGIKIEPAIADIGDAEAVGRRFARLDGRARRRSTSSSTMPASREHPTFERTTPAGWRDDVERQSERRLLLRPRGAAGHAGEAAAASSSTSARSTASRRFGDPAYSAGQGRDDQPHPLARAWSIGRFGIRVNIVCPGTVRTPIWERARRSAIRRFLTQLTRWYPLGRIVEPIDVARAVAFLASDAAAAITGVVAAGRLRADRRQYRHGARTDARRFLRRRADWTGCGSASSGSAGSARSIARRSSASRISSSRRSARGPKAGSASSPRNSG